MNSNFSVSIKAKSLEKKELQAIKKYTGLTYAEISEKVKGDEPIYLCKLEATKLFSGVDALLELLESINSRYELQKENQLINLDELVSISEMAKKAKLSDIR